VGEREEGLERLSEIADPDQHLVARLGVLCVSITKEIAKLLPDLRKPAGVIVAARSLSPSAVESGLAPGDVIYALNGAPVAALEALRSMIDALKPGDAVVLQIERDGALRFLTFSID
jgi:serine protease Do